MTDDLPVADALVRRDGQQEFGPLLRELSKTAVGCAMHPPESTHQRIQGP